MKPRYYQTDAVNSIFRYFYKGGTGNPVVAMPTGTGKSIVIADFAKQVCQTWPSQRILVLTHVKELIGQNYGKLCQIWPGGPSGIFSAGLGIKDVGRQITFGGIKSVMNALSLFRPDLIIVDECHLISPKEDSDYRQAIAYYKYVNPHLKVIGLTATPFRVGQGMIIEPGGIFTDICFDLTTTEAFNKLLGEGYLATLVPQETDTQLDVTGVHTTSGDYNQRELQKAVDKTEVTRAALAEAVRKGGGRKKWLVFTSGVEHCEHVTKMLVTEFGLSAACVHSGNKQYPFTGAMRDENIKLFKQGKIQVLVNNGVLTTGFDDPEIDLIVILRPTQSPGLWVQILGRGTRPCWPTKPGERDDYGTPVCNWHLWPAGAIVSGRYDLETIQGRLLCIAEGPKPDCLVLDFAANSERLGQINNPKIPGKKKKTGDAPPCKTCESCGTYNHCSARVCCHCGAPFPEGAVKFKVSASKAELIAKSAPTEVIEEWFNVANMDYSVFKIDPFWRRPRTGEVVARHSPPPSLRVTYNVGGTPARSFTEHVNFEGDGVGLMRAREWWHNAAPGHALPSNVEEAIDFINRVGLKEPKRIRVWVNRPNPKVQYRDF